MLLKISVALCVAMVTYFHQTVAQQPNVMEVVQAHVVDTLVCPQQDHLSLIIDQGLEEETLEVCSLISWANVEFAVPVATHENVGYGAWLSGESDDLLSLSVVTIYKVKLDSYKLYALRDPFLEVQWVLLQEAGETLVVPSGLRPGVAYEAWQTITPGGSFGPQVLVAELPE